MLICLLPYKLADHCPYYENNNCIFITISVYLLAIQRFSTISASFWHQHARHLFLLLNQSLLEGLAFGLFYLSCLWSSSSFTENAFSVLSPPSKKLVLLHRRRLPLPYGIFYDRIPFDDHLGLLFPCLV